MATIQPFPDPRISAPDRTGFGGFAQSPDGATVHVMDDGTARVILSNDADGVSDEPQRPKQFDDNLAEDIDEMSLSTVASDLLEAINADIDSRRDWVENYNKGMDLLGLKLEDAPTAGTGGDGKNVSRVRHPLLLWAIIKGQSMARAELLPAAGPVKVMNDGEETADASQRADDMETDFNHYLTVTASEYYPDMDRGLFYLYYGGTLFKKIYNCPIRNRPVSECVYMPDLIVSNDTTDLDNASRITHEIQMQPGTLKQLQDQGVYKDIDLGTPNEMPSPVQMKEAEIQGINVTQQRPKDRLYTIYECYCNYDLSDYGIDAKAKRPLPYRITIDRDSRKILEIRRNWRADDKQYKARKHFVKYGLVPGFGFLDLGFLHILGNHTKALTALWRICIDAGMFANFPGGLKLKGNRNSNNELNPGPGEFAEVDGNGVQKISDVIMPMPYKDPSPVMLQMIQDLAQDGQQMAGTLDIEVGEGRTNVPVGTMMSMVEQQTQVMAAVHKRLHTAQKSEFILLKELFAENPKALWEHARNPAREWQSAQDFQDMDLVPASDPNVPAQIHRRMQAMMFLQIIQTAGPAAMQLFNINESLKWILKQGVGMSDAQNFINPALAQMQASGQMPGQQQGQPGQPGQQPDQGLAQAAMQQATLEHQSKMAELQQKGQLAQQGSQFDQAELTLKSANQKQDRDAKLAIATEAEKTKRLGLMLEAAKANREHQRAVDEATQAHLATQLPQE